MSLGNTDGEVKWDVGRKEIPKSYQSPRFIDFGEKAHSSVKNPASLLHIVSEQERAPFCYLVTPFKVNRSSP